MTVKQTAGKIGRAILPKPLYQLLVQPIGAFLWRRALVYQKQLADQMISRYGTVVQSGPFAGMNYLSDAADGCIVPKLLGCYEEEIADTLERLIRKGYDHVIDVGCASGYYVVGMAQRLPYAHVYGFDLDASARARCRELIERNHVSDRVTLSGECTASDLDRLLRPHSLLICDIDGGEFDLINPDTAPGLRYVDMIVELHDYVNPMISTAIQERFKASHHIEIIPSSTRMPSDYPQLSVYSAKDWSGALDERRPRPQAWAILEAFPTDSSA